MFHVHADGAYNPVLNQGGWGAIVIQNGNKQSYSGLVRRTTNNRMEIVAAVQGILNTPQNEEVVVYTDSQYLFGCVARGWQRRANRDLWDQLDAAASQRKVRWEWIEGDSQNPFHKEAHNLATSLSSQRTETKAKVAGELSHLDAEGRPRMVDITEKPDTEREAVAKCLIRMSPATLDRIIKGEIPKGNVFVVAQLAGIMAAKKTPDLIPLCHPLLLDKIDVELKPDEKESAIEITSRVKNTGKTGAEMEALTAAAVAALTIYDMCKAVERGMKIDNLRLIRKSGGKSGKVVLEPD